MISALAPPTSALKAFGLGVQNTAHNLANILTAGFNPARVTYSELPAQSGVAPNVSTPATTELAASSQRSQVSPSPQTPPIWSNPSGTNLLMEMVNLTTNSRAYQANAKVIQTGDQMLGTAVDLKV